MKKILFVSILLLISGCAGFGQIEDVSDLSPNQLKKVHNMDLYDNDKGLEYDSLGKVKGLSCKGSAISGSARKEAAIMQLKIKAMQKGANAILFPTCSHDASVDWSNNCWESWTCVGEAIIVN